MRWLILILILSLLILTGCSSVGHFEKQPVLEQYIILQVENNTTLETNTYSDPNINSCPH